MAPGKAPPDFNAIINAGTKFRSVLSKVVFHSLYCRSPAPSESSSCNRDLRQSSETERSRWWKQSQICSKSWSIPVSCQPSWNWKGTSYICKHIHAVLTNLQRTVSTTQKNAAARSTLKPAAGNVDAEWTHDLHTLNNPSASRAAQAPRRAPRQTRTERLYASLSGSASSPALNTQFNVVGATKASQGITIKGLAGPYTVMAKNFVQGTTAEDIESAMTPVGGVCLSCRIVTDRPTVIAEIIFESKEGADNVVSTFNNQNVSAVMFSICSS